MIKLIVKLHFDLPILLKTCKKWKILWPKETVPISLPLHLKTIGLRLYRTLYYLQIGIFSKDYLRLNRWNIQQLRKRFTCFYSERSGGKLRDTVYVCNATRCSGRITSSSGCSCNSGGRCLPRTTVSNDASGSKIAIEVGWIAARKLVPSPIVPRRH